MGQQFAITGLTNVNFTPGPDDGGHLDIKNDPTRVEVESDKPEEPDANDDFDFSEHFQVDEMVSRLFSDQGGVLNNPMFQMCLTLFSRGEGGKHFDDVQAFNRVYDILRWVTASGQSVMDTWRLQGSGDEVLQRRVTTRVTLICIPAWHFWMIFRLDLNDARRPSIAIRCCQRHWSSVTVSRFFLIIVLLNLADSADHRWFFPGKKYWFFTKRVASRSHQDLHGMSRDDHNFQHISTPCRGVAAQQILLIERVASSGRLSERAEVPGPGPGGYCWNMSKHVETIGMQVWNSQLMGKWLVNIGQWFQNVSDTSAEEGKPVASSRA